MFHVAGLNIQQGSDHHAPLNQVDALASQLILQIRDDADAVVLNGDLFDTSDGQSAQLAVGDVLRSVATATDKLIIFVPGNHCLRGAGQNAWNNFGALPANVIAPLNNPTSPITIPYKNGSILVGNIFYDFNLFDPTILGLNRDRIHAFYKTLPDGHHLLGGATDSFKSMAINLATAITPNVKILITHCVPHPSLVSFKAAARTTEVIALEQKLNTTFICDSVADEEIGKMWNKTGEQHRLWWNHKIYYMGSNVLSRTEANPRDGLVVFSGHNHRAENRVIRQVGDKSVIFCSFQFPFSRPNFQWSLPRNILPQTSL
jgi:hypothetical protein